MELAVIGLSYKTAPVEVREQLSLTSQQYQQVLAEIAGAAKIEEGVILSTCNRIELYLVAQEASLAQEFGVALFTRLANLGQQELQTYIYNQTQLAVVDHLYQVVSGLDSLVVGESQILGQVKRAFAQAQEAGVVDTYLHQLFTESFRVGKRARRETKINAKAASISYVAVELARDIFGTLEGETVLILGAGKMSELTLKSLVDHGVKGVMVANRTYQRGKKLAAKFEGEVIRWNQLEDWITEVDIIIASTAAPHYVLHYDLVQRAMSERRGPLFLIDIAVPRDIEPEIGHLPGVHHYDIDDLETVVDQNISQRKEEVTAVEEIIDQEIAEFEEWLGYRRCVPLITELRQKAEKIKQEELKRAKKKLTSAEQEVVGEVAHRLTNKLLHTPTVKIKELGAQNNEQALEVIRQVFDLDD
ncbi:glutamyl-tRNA reductase [Halanaerobaculum tunisiense]